MKAQLGTIHLAAKNYGRNIPTERSGRPVQQFDVHGRKIALIRGTGGVELSNFKWGYGTPGSGRQWILNRY